MHRIAVSRRDLPDDNEFIEKVKVRHVVEEETSLTFLACSASFRAGINYKQTRNTIFESMKERYHWFITLSPPSMVVVVVVFFSENVPLTLKFKFLILCRSLTNWLADSFKNSPSLVWLFIAYIAKLFVVGPFVVGPFLVGQTDRTSTGSRNRFLHTGDLSYLSTGTNASFPVLLHDEF